MKKIFTFFTALALLCAVGCEEQGDDNVNPNDKPNPEQPEEKPDDGSEIPDDAYITLNKEVLTFVPDGESVEVKVYSNYEWTLTNNCDWVTTSISGGEASEEGTAITLTADLTYDDREGTIIFNCGKAKKLLVVSQSFKEAIIADENNVFNVPAEGGNVIINYQTSVECEVIIPEEAKSWISLAPATRALVSESATLTVAENTTYSERSAVVKVVKVGDNTLFAEYTINQVQNDAIIADDAYITLNKEVLTFVPDGESVEVKVYSNYEWTLTNNCDWVTTSISGGEASEEGTAITLTADLTYDDREGTITFSCGKAKKLLVVSQGLKEVIISDENNTFNLPVEGGTVDIAYQTTVECEVIIPEEAKSWISLTPETRGLESGCATLNIAKSKAGADRRAVVKVVKMGDQSVFAEYTITQERNMDYIIFYTTTHGGTISPKNFDYLTNTYENGVGMLAFDGSKVTSIGDSAFSGCSSLTSVTIPDSVTSIGSEAFRDCTSLTSVTIPDSVTSIGSEAFRDCTSLTSVTIPDSVTSIGDNAFRDCDSLTSVYITDIAAWCNISFGNADSNPLRDAENLYLNNELVTDLIIPDGVTSIGSSAFYNCDSLTSITIPDSVTSIGDSAFSGCSSLTSVTIPDSVTSIGDDAFRYCNSLTSVTIGNGVTSIGSYAFHNCTSLTSVTIPDSVTSIGDDAFYNCISLTSVTIGNGVTSIGSYAFHNCTSLTSVTIGDSVTSIGISAFDGCTSLTSITIPDSVIGIRQSAFRDCTSLTSITFGNGVTYISHHVFSGCTSLTSVTIGNGVTEIGDWTFSSCTSLTSVTIPDSVTSIGYRTFDDCTSLTSVTIGNGVTEIGDYVFSDCTSLKEVYCKPTTPPSVGTDIFSNNAWGRKIYVPRNSVSAYKSASGWSTYAASIVGYDF